MTSYLRDSTAVLLLLSWGKLNTVTLFCNAVLHRKEADSRKKANFVRSTSDTDKRVAMLLHHNQVKNIRNSQSISQFYKKLLIYILMTNWKPLLCSVCTGIQCYDKIPTCYNFQESVILMSYIDSEQILSSKTSRKSLDLSNLSFSCSGE